MDKYEERVFWILVHILEDKKWRSVFSDGTPKLLEMIDIFDKKLEKTHPKIYNHILKNDVKLIILILN